MGPPATGVGGGAGVPGAGVPGAAEGSGADAGVGVVISGSFSNPGQFGALKRRHHSLERQVVNIGHGFVATTAVAVAAVVIVAALVSGTAVLLFAAPAQKLHIGNVYVQ